MGLNGQMSVQLLDLIANAAPRSGRDTRSKLPLTYFLTHVGNCKKTVTGLVRVPEPAFQWDDYRAVPSWVGESNLEEIRLRTAPGHGANGQRCCETRLNNRSSPMG